MRKVSITHRIPNFVFNPNRTVNLKIQAICFFRKRPDQEKELINTFFKNFSKIILHSTFL